MAPPTCNGLTQVLHGTVGVNYNVQHRLGCCTLLEHPQQAADDSVPAGIASNTSASPCSSAILEALCQMVIARQYQSWQLSLSCKALTKQLFYVCRSPGCIAVSARRSVRGCQVSIAQHMSGKEGPQQARHPAHLPALSSEPRRCSSLRGLMRVSWGCAHQSGMAAVCSMHAVLS